MARRKKEEALAMKLLVVFLVGCVATAVHFCFAWSQAEDVPRFELFLLQGILAITIVYIILYSIAVLVIHVFPSKKERARQIRESLPHRKPR